MLLGLVYPRLVVLVLGVEARLEVVDEGGGRRHQPTHHVVAGQQQACARVRRGRVGGRGRQGGAALAPLRYLPLDVKRASLRPTTVGRRLGFASADRFIDSFDLFWMVTNFLIKFIHTEP